MISSLHTLKIVPFENRTGSTSYRVSGSYPLSEEAPKGRIRKNFKTEEEAEAYRDHLLDGLQDHLYSRRATKLTDDQLTYAEAAYAKLRIAGREESLLDAVEYFLRHHRGLVDKDLTEAIDEFAETLKVERDANEKYITDTRSRLTAFAASVDTEIVNRITFEQTREFIYAATAAQTKKNRRAILNNFFNWSLDQGYASQNPIADLRVRVKDTKEKPGVFTVDQILDLLHASWYYLGGLLFPFTVVSVFTGLRPEENRRNTSWSNFTLEGSHPCIAAFGIAKTRSRYLSLTDNAAEMLRYAKQHNQQPGYWTQSHWLAVREAAGLDFSWTGPLSDVLRHTYASNTYMLHKDFGTLSHDMANSEDVLKSRYIVPIPLAEAIRFSEITMKQVVNHQTTKNNANNQKPTRRTA